jgi:phosphoesterase RecJ-like protein
MENEVIRLEWDAATQLIRSAAHVIVVGHIRPDGDDIGSVAGLGLALREQGKKVTMAVDEGVPAFLRFIPGAKDIAPALDHPTADVVVVVDTSDKERSGEVGAKAMQMGKPVIVVDHHATNTFFGDVHIVKSGYVSATEAVLEWLDYMKVHISQEVATALLTGVVTDTLAFRVGPVSAATFDVAKRLMERGADLKYIMQKTLNRRTTGTLPLEGRVLSRTQLEAGVIWTVVYRADLEEAGLPDETYLDLSSDLVKDDAAYISAQFTEVSAGEVRVSFRAVPGFDVASVAFQLGGGGHQLASGCTVRDLSVDEVVAKVIPLLKAAVERGRPLY